jgi:superoxide dismutase, Cu-Zn family
MTKGSAMTLHKRAMLPLATALAALAPTVPASAQESDGFGARHFEGVLTRLDLTAASPLDDAGARLVMVTHHGASTFVLHVEGVGSDAAGRTFGAHLHTGPCVPGNGAAAGPHYNQDVVEGAVPVRVNESTEVWLDFTVSPAGNAAAVAIVPFVPAPGIRAVVVHRDPTDHHTGVAGPRLACLPVSW